MAFLVAAATEVASGTTDAQGITGTWNKVLTGFSVAESAAPAAAAEVILRHGTTDAAAMLVAPINLDANGFGQYVLDPPVVVSSGVYVDRVSGTTTLVLYTVNL